MAKVVLEHKDIEGQILSPIVGRPTRSANNVYDLKFSDGHTYSTFKQELAQKAAPYAPAAEGQPAPQAVSLRVEVTQNGQYTNYDLLDIAPQGQLPPEGVPAGTIVQPAGAVQPVGTPVASGVVQPAAELPTQPPIPIVQGENPAERNERIVRQNVLGTAFNAVSALFQGAGPEALKELKGEALSLAAELYVIAMTGKPSGGTAPPATAEDVAALANAEVPGAVQVGTEGLPNWGSN